MRVSGDVKRVIGEAEKLGFAVERAGNGHCKFTKPGVRAVFFSGTPGDHRAIKNGVAKLRRACRGETV